LLAAITCGALFYRLKQPVIIGYLIGGLLVGPYALGFVSDVHTIEMFAEIGVALLMFALGVEFSLRELKPVYKVAVIGGALQILLAIALTGGVANLFGLSLGAGILLGCIIAISSTVIVLKVLMERGELDSMHGRIALGVLIVQDLSVVPIMVILPNLADPAHILGMPMLFALGKAALILALLAVVGTRVVPKLMARIAATRSRELFLLSSVALCFGTAAVTYSFGLSLALGAFLAGIIVSESDHSHQILADVIPLRDLFATLFFVSVGMMINPFFLISHLPAVGGLTLAIVLGKAVLIAGTTRLFGYTGRTSLAVGMGLAQIGEFSFVLAKMGRQDGLITEDFFSIILASALLSILVTPLMMQAATPLYRLMQRLPFVRATSRRKVFESAATAELKGLVDHVVICGFGRVGSSLGKVLVRSGIPVLVIDIDHVRIQGLRERGVPCLYGDSSNIEVLRHARLELARAMVVALPDPLACQMALSNAKLINPKVDVIARAQRSEDVEGLYQLGAEEVVQPEFEASIEVIRYTLAKLGYTSREVQRYSHQIRKEGYRQFQDEFNPDATPDLLEALGEAELTWLSIPPGSPLDGHTLREADVRGRTGVGVLAVKQEGKTIPNPKADKLLQAHDEILVMGTQAQLNQLTNFLSAVQVD
jgi:CPA2 family monovalent cation:H+ antiporter-2